ncbi:MYLK protein, partial [Polypterus senegalus]
MGDVQLVTATQISKTTLTLGRPSQKNSSIPIEPPAFILPPRNIRIPLGGTARLDGKIRGYPEPRVTWYKNGIPLAGKDRNMVEQSLLGSFSLVIKGVQADDGGKYTCEAVNEGGIRQVTVELTVEVGLKPHNPRAVKPFFETFQTDAPMMPFLAKDLQALLKSLISCFMKREVLDNIKTPVQMLKIDVLDKTLHLPLKEVDLGFATKQALEKASEKLLEKPLPGQQFRRECVAFLSTTAKKLLDKCPLNYAAVRHMACLDPVTMISNERRAISMFEKLLQLLLNAKWNTAEDCDKILSEYKMFLTEMVQHHKEEFQGYRSSSCWLDTFMGRFAGDKAEYAILWKSMKDLFTLSHGQAAVERGYCVNKDMLVTNLKGRTLMSLVAHLMEYCQSPSCSIAKMPGCDMSNTLMMEKKKKKETENDKQREELRSEITKVAAKGQKIITSIEAMQEEADAMAEKAERKQDFTLLTKSNAYRKSVAEKKKEVIGLDAVLSDLKEQQQHCF